jgi:hypothetical protein
MMFLTHISQITFYYSIVETGKKIERSKKMVIHKKVVNKRVVDDEI